MQTRTAVHSAVQLVNIWLSVSLVPKRWYFVCTWFPIMRWVYKVYRSLIIRSFACNSLCLCVSKLCELLCKCLTGRVLIAVFYFYRLCRRMSWHPMWWPWSERSISWLCLYPQRSLMRRRLRQGQRSSPTTSRWAGREREGEGREEGREGGKEEGREREREKYLFLHFSQIAARCYSVRNYNSLKAVLAGLQCTPIFRLKKTWKEVPSKRRKWVHVLELTCARFRMCCCSCSVHACSLYMHVHVHVTTCMMRQVSLRCG